MESVASQSNKLFKGFNSAKFVKGTKDFLTSKFLFCQLKIEKY